MCVFLRLFKSNLFWVHRYTPQHLTKKTNKNNVKKKKKKNCEFNLID